MRLTKNQKAQVDKLREQAATKWSCPVKEIDYLSCCWMVIRGESLEGNIMEELELTGSEKQIKWAKEIISRNPSYPKKFTEIVNGKWLLKEGFSFLSEEQKKSCMKEVEDSSFWINVDFKDLNKACHRIGIRIKKELGYTPLSMAQAIDRLKEGVVVDPLCTPKEFIFPKEVFGEIEDDEYGFHSVIWKEGGEKKYYEHEGKWLSPSEWEV